VLCTRAGGADVSDLDRLRERALRKLGRAEFGDDVFQVAAEDVVALFDEAEALRDRVAELEAAIREHYVQRRGVYDDRDRALWKKGGCYGD